MDFRLLGPLEVAGDGDGDPTVPIGTGRQRALLALLVLHANETLTSDRLIGELWGESPPPSAVKMLHNQVSALRRALGDGRLETHGRAYRLAVRPGERDLDRFDDLVTRGRAALDADPEGAAELLGRALSLWRGPPLADLAYEPFATAEIGRLEERRWTAFEVRIDAELALGRHAEAVPELEAAVAAQPLRERLHGRLMLALYRSGRQAEALEAYRRARRTLVDEIGVEPGAPLRELQEAILAQDPALDLPAGLEELPAELDRGSPVLAGRARELIELGAMLADAAEGRPGLALVSGPPGSGKTRLAAELAREALRRRLTVAYAGPADAAAIARAGHGERAGLLLLDDADALDAETSASAAALAEGGRRLLVVALHARPDPPAALAAHAHRAIVLGPLSDEAVEEIARLYLDEVEPLAVRELVAASQGFPLAVHRLAAERARSRAARDAGASAGRTATERRELRAAEDRLSHELLAVRAADERGRRYGADGAPLPAVCPYLGLATFDAAHAEYFFGRERLVADMVARLVGARLLAVVGPSGSGKSSAVRAGLLPSLAAGVLPGSERRRQALMRPGAHPLAELRRVLAGDDGPTVLLADQFEELFTVCRDEPERAAFADALAGLTRDPARDIQVIVAVRADFYGHCAAYERLARLVGANQVLVGPMRADELQRAIVEPARRAGLRVEPSLAAAMIDDVLDEPGGLPLLSAALLEQWRERDGHVLRRAAYERTGGVRGAVGRLAEATYAQLSEPERAAAKRILLRLADAREEGAGFVRRRVPLDEIERTKDAATAAALAALVDSRLVTADEETLEVAHEALLREWPRLRGWLEEDADGRRLHQHLIHAAREWAAAGRDPVELYRGARLSAALDWSAGHAGDLNALERAFLEASRTEAEQEADHQRRANRRLRAQLAALAVLLALAVATGIVALDQRGEARDAARVADAQRLGVEALGEERLDRALLLARAAVTLDDSPATRGNLLSVLLRTPASLGVVAPGWGIYGAALSPDGRLMATGDERGRVAIYDAATRLAVTPPYEIRDGLIQDVHFSPDSKTLALSFIHRNDAAPQGIVDLLDARTGRRRLRVQLPPASAPGGFVFADVVFLPDGRDLLVRQVAGASPVGPASPMYRVDGTTGAVTGRLTVGRSATSFNASATADRRRVFVTSAGDGRTWELDPAAMRVVRSWPAGDASGAVSPDGRSFALGGLDGRVRLLDLATGRVRRLPGGHRGRVLRMRFTPGGRTLVTAGIDGRVLAWSLAGDHRVRLVGRHSKEIDGLDLSRDGRTLLTASLDGRAILWDLAGDRRLDRRFAAGPRFPVAFTPRGIAVSPDGRTLAVTQADGDVVLIDTRTLQRRASIHALRGPAAAAAFSPDGKVLAVTGAGGRLTLWNTRTRAPAGELRGMRADSEAVAFSPDGRRVAAAEAIVSAAAFRGPPQPLRVWDLRRRAPTALRARMSANLIAYSPGGRLIAGATLQHGAEVRDARTGRLVARPGATGEGVFSRSVAFSPDGRLLFVGLFDGTGHLFATDGWKPVGQALKAHTARVTFASFTPDARTLVTAAADGTVILWDVATQSPIGPPLRLAHNTFASVALSPDGSHLYAVSTRGEGISLDLRPAAWKRHACQVAGRELTAAEWRDALPRRPYRAVCSGR